MAARVTGAGDDGVAAGSVIDGAAETAGMLELTAGTGNVIAPPKCPPKPKSPCADAISLRLELTRNGDASGATQCLHHEKSDSCLACPRAFSYSGVSRTNDASYNALERPIESARAAGAGARRPRHTHTHPT